MGWLFLVCALVLGVASVWLFWVGVIFGMLGGFGAGDVPRMLTGSMVVVAGVVGVVLAVEYLALAGQVLRGVRR